MGSRITDMLCDSVVPRFHLFPSLPNPPQLKRPCAQRKRQLIALDQTHRQISPTSFGLLCSVESNVLTHSKSELANSPGVAPPPLLRTTPTHSKLSDFRPAFAAILEGPHLPSLDPLPILQSEPGSARPHQRFGSPLASHSHILPNFVTPFEVRRLPPKVRSLLLGPALL